MVFDGFVCECFDECFDVGVVGFDVVFVDGVGVVVECVENCFCVFVIDVVEFF